MTVVARGSATGPAIPATSAPSKARPNNVQVSVSGLPDPVAWSIAVGSSVAAPTTFGGLGGSPLFLSPADGATTLSVNAVPGGTFTAQMSSANWDLSGYTVGDHMWLCVFELAPPVSGTAVVAHVDLGLLVA